MSFKITTSGLVVTQGDTALIPLRFQCDISNAVICFVVRRKIDGMILIDKSVTEHIDPLQGKTLIRLESADTFLAPGVYEVEMKIIFENGNVFTFFPPKTGEKAHFHVMQSIIQGGENDE